MKVKSNSLTRSIQFILLLLNIGLCAYLFMPSGIDITDTENNTAEYIDANDMKFVTTENKEFPLINAYQEVIDRPLFMEDRRPYVLPEPTTITNNKESESQQFSLNAIVITSDNSIAILQYADGKTLKSIALGETIDGWTLTEVHDQHVVLKKGDDTNILELEIKGSLQKKSTEKNKQVGG